MSVQIHSKTPLKCKSFSSSSARHRKSLVLGEARLDVSREEAQPPLPPGALLPLQLGGMELQGSGDLGVPMGDTSMPAPLQAAWVGGRCQ